jgi:hypothetical protein
MRSSYSGLALVAVASALLVTASGCRIEAHTQSQFEDSSQPAKTSVKDWAGEPITIQNGGINPLSGTGGVEVKISATATKITAEAVFAAHADDDKESEADESIQEAIASLTIDESNGFKISCGHGAAHGTSSVAGSGCKILRVTIPAGSVTMPLDLSVGNGAGSIRVGLADAGDVPTVKRLSVNNSGLGDVDVRTQTVAGASLALTGEGAVQIALPTAFSATSVTFAVDETDPDKARARLVAGAFPGIVSGSPYPTAGATADAVASLSMTSKGPFDDDTITLVSF